MSRNTYVIPYPPTANTYYRWTKSGMRLSTKGRKYKTAVYASLLKKGRRKPKKVLGAVAVAIEIYPPDKRKRDLDNTLKPILDAIKDVLIEDDSEVRTINATKHAPVKGGRVRLVIAKVKDDER